MNEYQRYVDRWFGGPAEPVVSQRAELMARNGVNLKVRQYGRVPDRIPKNGARPFFKGEMWDKFREVGWTSPSCCKLKEAVRRRAEYMCKVLGLEGNCEICGQRDGSLTHHWEYSTFPVTPMQNLAWSCEPCHLMLHGLDNGEYLLRVLNECLDEDLDEEHREEIMELIGFVESWVEENRDVA